MVNFKTSYCVQLAAYYSDGEGLQRAENRKLRWLTDRQDN
jgi:hypothetical protein